MYIERGPKSHLINCYTFTSNPSFFPFDQTYPPYHINSGRFSNVRNSPNSNSSGEIFHSPKKLFFLQKKQFQGRNLFQIFIPLGSLLNPFVRSPLLLYFVENIFFLEFYPSKMYQRVKLYLSFQLRVLKRTAVAEGLDKQRGPGFSSNTSKGKRKSIRKN